MKALSNLPQRYQRLRGARREAATLALCFLIGALLIPIAIFALGRVLLGTYTNGGFFSYLADFWLQLIRLTPAFWLVALGPYLALWFWRLLQRLPHR
jgi:hypothetical protein